MRDRLLERHPALPFVRRARRDRPRETEGERFPVSLLPPGRPIQRGPAPPCLHQSLRPIRTSRRWWVDRVLTTPHPPHAMPLDVPAMPDRILLPPFGAIALDETGGAEGVGTFPTRWFGPRPVPVAVRGMRSGDGASAGAALAAFAALDATTCARAERLLLDRCHDVLDDRGITAPLERTMAALEDPSAVWAFVRDPALVIAARGVGNDRWIDVCLAFECDWDPEHGGAIVFRDGQTVAAVGSYDEAL